MINKLRDVFREKMFPVYMYGPTGVGKSFASALVYCRYGCGDPFFDAWFIRFSNLTDDMMTKSKAGMPTPWERITRDRQLIVIDEIGSGAKNEWRNEILWEILERRRGKPLILTSNLTPDELLTRFDARIQSRIMQGSLIALLGKDKRVEGLSEKRSFTIEVKT